MGIAFDTLKFVETLEAGGFSPTQARAAAEAFNVATGEQLATKADLASLATDVASLAAATKADLAAHAAATKADLAAVAASAKADLFAAVADLRSDLRQTELRLEGKIEATKFEILKWMFGQTLLILGAVIALTRLGH